MATFTELLASFDADSGKRGKQFEHFVKWFLKNDPEWSTQVDQVWLWEEYPERWGVDCGIDLVFRHRNGEAWAVQAKCYSHLHDITKHDVDKFLSESNRKGIDKRLLIATTDRIGGNAKQVCEAQEKTVFRYLLSNFESANIEYPPSLAELNAAKRKPKPTPREHQIEAISSVTNGFQSCERGQLIMACGTGKTFTTLWIKEELGATSTLILLPSLGLLSQTLHEWTLAANVPFEVLCVCSDETVGKKGTDEAMHSIADVAFPVTSNVDEIRTFLKLDAPKVVFSTYQSSPLVAAAQGDRDVPAFDLAIADEAHRCAGKVGNDFTTVLDPMRIRADKRLFATATPRTYSTNVKKAAGERGIDVVGMDDEAVFGSVLHSLPFGEAIKRGLLTDYQVVIIGVDNPTIAAWIENRELVKTESGIENDAESLAAQIGLLKAFKDYDLRRVISFHSRVKRAEQFSKDLLEVVDWVGDDHKPDGLIKTDFVSGEMATDKRRVKLSQLKSIGPNERGLLTNARCLSEGVDVPSLDGVAFIDPRSSQIDIVQAVGRAIRLSANKSTGTIVLPVFIEGSKDGVASIEGSNFKPIWDVLNALKAHDDVLSAELDQIRADMGRRGDGTVSKNALAKIHIDLAASIDQSFGAALRSLLVERVSNNWEFWFGLLQNYVSKYGDCIVSRRYEDARGYKLGQWVRSQRSKKHTLDQKQRQRLEVLDGWSWSVFSDAWDVGYSSLTNYYKQFGTCQMGNKYVQANGYRLGQWVAVQRGNRKTMTPVRVTKLEAVPGWVWDPRDAAWELGFSQLLDYRKNYGNYRVSKSYLDASGKQLGLWISNQRRRRYTVLTDEQRERFDSLEGWMWEPNDEAWDIGYRYLLEYSKVNGDCMPSQEFMLENGFRLGSWVKTQRTNKSSLPSERIAQLESLNGWVWVPSAAAWEIGYQHLCEYANFHGNCLVPFKYTIHDGYKLGNWITTQRTNRSSLSSDRLQRLIALPGWVWHSKEAAWEAGYHYLSEYEKANGNCLVPQIYKTLDGYRLGDWVISQRTTRDTLSDSRVRKLEALPGWIWDARENSWETGYKNLLDYVTQHGNCRVPIAHIIAEDYKFGIWVMHQRRSQLILSEFRRGKLEAVPGWSWMSKNDEAWELAYSHLLEYADVHRHCWVPLLYKLPDGFKLGQWVARQRDKRSRHSPERISRLESLQDWTWSPQDSLWELGFRHLSEYCVKHGNCLVSRSYDQSNEYQLSSWVNTQRGKRSSMPQERSSRLESLPGWTWSVLDDKRLMESLSATKESTYGDVR